MVENFPKLTENITDLSLLIPGRTNTQNWKEKWRMRRVQTKPARRVHCPRYSEKRLAASHQHLIKNKRWQENCKSKTPQVNVFSKTKTKHILTQTKVNIISHDNPH
jgi:hypothetical protein